MQKPLISIIVPIYNSENHLNRCIDSLLAQSYSNIEIIAVNDGSTDNSKNIIDEYSKDKKNNIIVVNQKNLGSGLARQRGINTLNGDYFTFVDSDDKLKQNAIEDLVKDIGTNTDIIISGFVTITNNKKNKIFHVPTKNSKWMELKYPCTAFKLYKTEYIKSNRFKYTNFPILEDVIFNVIAFSNTKNIIIQKKSNYINYLRNNSLTSNIKTKHDICDALEYIAKNINRDKYQKKLLEFLFLKISVQNIMMNNKVLSVKDSTKLWKKYYHWLNKNCSNLIHWINEEKFQINLICLLFIFFTKIKIHMVLIALLKYLKIGM